MIKVLVKKQSYYPVSTPNIKKRVRSFLMAKGIISDTVVSIAIVGKKKMLELSKKYMDGDKQLHNVLSFTENEVNEKFVYPPDGPIQLGEVVLCYPKIFEEAKMENKRIEEKVLELVEHGLIHLLGYHHK